MAYRIERGQDPSEGLFLPLAIRNRYSKGFLVAGDGIDHQLVAFGCREDYGEWGEFGQTLGSTGDGSITAPSRGLLDIVIPASRLWGVTQLDDGTWIGGFDLRRSLRCKLLAVPADPSLTTVLANIVLTFGRATMDRITLDVCPFYPNAPTAGVAGCQVAQFKQFLATAGLYDAMEAALPGTTDPATISWNTGGDMTIGGPLSNVAALALGKTPAQMAAIMAAAALNVI